MTVRLSMCVFIHTQRTRVKDFLSLGQEAPLGSPERGRISVSSGSPVFQASCPTASSPHRNMSSPAPRRWPDRFLVRQDHDTRPPSGCCHFAHSDMPATRNTLLTSPYTVPHRPPIFSCISSSPLQKQAVVGNLLRERMFKDIGRLRIDSSLIQKL